MEAISESIALSELQLEAFRKNIEVVRRLRHVTQTDVADAVGISQPFYTAFVKHRTETINLLTALKIINYLNIELKFIFDSKLDASNFEKIVYGE